MCPAVRGAPPPPAVPETCGGRSGRAGRSQRSRSAGQDLAHTGLVVRRCSRKGSALLAGVAGKLSSTGLLAAVGEFGSERGLLIEDGVPVAFAGDQPCVMKDG